MDVILKQDVEKLGFKDEIISVKNGFGRNYLIPKGLAILATESAVKVFERNFKTAVGRQTLHRSDDPAVTRQTRR